MATYQYVTSRPQDALLTRVLDRLNAEGQNPPLASVDDLIALKVTAAIEALATEQASVELTKIANAYASATPTGRDQLLASADSVRNLPPSLAEGKS